ncbi:MAG: 30S ribosomal protein S20 [Alphaproteobacteria bacterium]|mgnify:FL=1|nr:30S ribosomal protein S20 [Alphaproteobacteria bacterium]
MANIKSAAKAARKAVKAQARNQARKSRVRTHVRAVEDALAKGDKDAAVKAMKAAEPEIVRGATKGVMHANTAARKVSRLAKRVNKLAASA